MRISIELHRKTCVVRAFDQVIYLADVSDRLEVHQAMEHIANTRQCDHMFNYCGQDDTVFFVEFTLAEAGCVPALPNEEALIEWLWYCKDAIYTPSLLTLVGTKPTGIVETLRFYQYEDSVERVATGQHWPTTDPAELAEQLGYIKLEWQHVDRSGITQGVFEEELGEEIFA